MTIIPEDLTGVDVGLARRIISTARSIAPSLHSLDGEDREDALAILVGVAAEAEARGARFVASQAVGSGSMSYTQASSLSWFTDDDRAGLRAICLSASMLGGGHPVGRFPKATKVFKQVWPEEEEE